MNSKRVVLVGAGRVSKHYSHLFREFRDQLPDIEIIAVVDKDERKARELAKEFQCTYFTDIEKLSEECTADLCIILTPSQTHYSLAKSTLSLGINTLVEKPSTLLISDSVELGDIATQSNLYLATVHQNRFNKAITFAKSVIDNGLLGNIISVAIRLIWNRPQSYYEDEWHGRWPTDGGVVSQQAFHHLDIARFLCGPIENVCSFGATLGHKIDVDDVSVGILRFCQGALGTFELTTSAPNRDREASIRVVGTQGVLGIGGVALNELMEFESNLDRKSAYRDLAPYSEKFNNGYGVSHYRVLQEIFLDISNGTRNYVTWNDSVETLKLIHSIYASQEQQVVIHSVDELKSNRLGIPTERNNRREV